ncbi:MAG: sugar transferase [Blautia sp.]
MDIPKKIMKDCNRMGVVTHVQLAALNELGKNQVVEEIAGYMVLSSSINIVSSWQLLVKRLMDIAGGLVGCIFTGIIYIFIAPIMKVKSPGPVFFSQVRMGKNGKPFKIYKFRSMYMDAEERKKELMEKNNIKDGLMFKMDDDPRIIKGIGHFIRKTSLDEFPQFWNILKGDMSLVGTRPPTMDEWDKYELHHRRRLAIKPGLTGMWQVSGRSEITDFEEVVELDTKYIEQWSIGLDIKILFKTVTVVFTGSGAK